MMSSRLGLVAEVIATESPSQLRPVVIHRTWAVTASVFFCSAYGLAVARHPVSSLALNRSAAAGRRPAGPSPACRRSSSAPAPSRAAPSAPRRSRPRRSQPGTARSAASAPSAASGATNATSLPSLATYIGSIPRISAAPATAGRTGTRASRTIIATDGGARELVEHRRDAAAGRVAQAAQLGPTASSSASTTGHSERRVGLDLGVELELAAREHDRRAVLADRCPDSRIRSPGRSAAGDSRARGSRRPIPVVQTYIPSA